MVSTVYAQKVRVWIDPYTPGQDQLSVLKNDYERVISGNFSVDTGVLELVQKGGVELTKLDWDTVLNYPTYRLFINVSAFNLCVFVSYLRHICCCSVNVAMPVGGCVCIVLFFFSHGEETFYFTFLHSTT